MLGLAFNQCWLWLLLISLFRPVNGAQPPSKRTVDIPETTSLTRVLTSDVHLDIAKPDTQLQASDLSTNLGRDDHDSPKETENLHTVVINSVAINSPLHDSASLEILTPQDVNRPDELNAPEKIDYRKLIGMWRARAAWEKAQQMTVGVIAADKDKVERVEKQLKAVIRPYETTPKTSDETKIEPIVTHTNDQHLSESALPLLAQNTQGPREVQLVKARTHQGVAPSFQLAIPHKDVLLLFNRWKQLISPPKEIHLGPDSFPSAPIHNTAIHPKPDNHIPSSPPIIKSSHDLSMVPSKDITSNLHLNALGTINSVKSTQSSNALGIKESIRDWDTRAITTWISKSWNDKEVKVPREVEFKKLLDIWKALTTGVRTERMNGEGIAVDQNKAEGVEKQLEEATNDQHLSGSAFSSHPQNAQAARELQLVKAHAHRGFAPSFQLFLHHMNVHFPLNRCKQLFSPPKEIHLRPDSFPGTHENHIPSGQLMTKLSDDLPMAPRKYITSNLHPGTLGSINSVKSTQSSSLFGKQAFMQNWHTRLLSTWISKIWNSRELNAPRAIEFRKLLRLWEAWSAWIKIERMSRGGIAFDQNKVGRLEKQLEAGFLPLSATPKTSHETKIEPLLTHTKEQHLSEFPFLSHPQNAQGARDLQLVKAHAHPSFAHSFQLAIQRKDVHLLFNRWKQLFSPPKEIYRRPDSLPAPPGQPVTKLSDELSMVPRKDIISNHHPGALRGINPVKSTESPLLMGKEALLQNPYTRVLVTWISKIWNDKLTQQDLNSLTVKKVSALFSQIAELKRQTMKRIKDFGSYSATALEHSSEKMASVVNPSIQLSQQVGKDALPVYIGKSTSTNPTTPATTLKASSENNVEPLVTHQNNQPLSQSPFPSHPENFPGARDVQSVRAHTPQGVVSSLQLAVQHKDALLLNRWKQLFSPPKEIHLQPDSFPSAQSQKAAILKPDNHLPPSQPVTKLSDELSMAPGKEIISNLHPGALGTINLAKSTQSSIPVLKQAFMRNPKTRLLLTWISKNPNDKPNQPPNSLAVKKVPALFSQIAESQRQPIPAKSIKYSVTTLQFPSEKLSSGISPSDQISKKMGQDVLPVYVGKPSPINKEILNTMTGSSKPILKQKTPQQRLRSPSSVKLVILISNIFNKNPVMNKNLVGKNDITINLYLDPEVHARIFSLFKQLNQLFKQFSHGEDGKFAHGISSHSATDFKFSPKQPGFNQKLSSVGPHDTPGHEPILMKGQRPTTAEIDKTGKYSYSILEMNRIVAGFEAFSNLFEAPKKVILNLHKDHVKPVSAKTWKLWLPFNSQSWTNVLAYLRSFIDVAPSAGAATKLDGNRWPHGMIGFRHPVLPEFPYKHGFKHEIYDKFNRILEMASPTKKPLDVTNPTHNFIHKAPRIENSVEKNPAAPASVDKQASPTSKDQPDRIMTPDQSQPARHEAIPIEGQKEVVNPLDQDHKQDLTSPQPQDNHASQPPPVHDDVETSSSTFKLEDYRSFDIPHSRTLKSGKKKSNHKSRLPPHWLIRYKNLLLVIFKNIKKYLSLDHLRRTSRPVI